VSSHTVIPGTVSSLASEAKQSRVVCVTLDCFAEPVIGPRFARTRWLAMPTGETYVLVLAAQFARVLNHVSPSKIGGRGEGRVAAAPGAPAQRRIARARKPQVQAVITLGSGGRRNTGSFSFHR